MTKRKYPIGLDGKQCKYFSRETFTCGGSDAPCRQNPNVVGGCLVEIELNRLARHEPSPGGTVMYHPGLGAYIF